MIAAEAAAGLAGGIISGLDKLFTSDDEREAAKLKLAEALQAPTMGQIEINKIEAASSSWFTSGWRPSIGWVCSMSLLWSYLGHGILSWILVIFAPGIAPPPRLDGGEIMPLVLTMLGMGSIKSFDLLKGTRK